MNPFMNMIYMVTIAIELISEIQLRYFFDQTAVNLAVVN